MKITIKGSEDRVKFVQRNINGKVVLISKEL